MQNTTHPNVKGGQSQNAKILAHLRKGRTISNKTSHRKPFYCENLQARIWDLRHLWNIDVKSRKLPGTNAVEYFIEPEDASEKTNRT